MMDRLVLSDAAWERMAPLVARSARPEGLDRARQPDVRGRCAVDRALARVLPGVIFRRRSGDWNSVFRRFSRWSIKGVWWRIFEAMSNDAELEYLIVDSTSESERISTPLGRKRGV